MSTPIPPLSSPPLVAEIKLAIPANGFAPSHHVLAPAPGTSLSSYLPHWSAQPAKRSSSLDARSSSKSRSRSADSTRSTSRGRRQQEQQQDQDLSNGITCLPSSIALVDLQKAVRIGFRNPWPSWHKPSVSELWQGLEWGEDQDPAIDYAIQDADIGALSDGLQDSSIAPYLDSRPASPVHGEARDPSPTRPVTLNVPATAYTRQQKIKMACKQLLTIQEPDFDFDTDQAKLKATWLGHAGVLLQFPPLNAGDRPIRILFDPIFSQRCSPTQVAGPLRSYPAPCPISKLPPIDMVIISHNHYDHLDYDTIRDLWNNNKDHIRFIVPLGNKEWFVDATFHPDASATAESTAIPPSTSATTVSASSSTWSLAPSSVTHAVTTSNIDIPQDRVTELDWWDEVHLTRPGANAERGQALRVVCTPAQHGSGRYGVDANCALWSSWFIEHPAPSAEGTPLRAYFGGDTGCQFHGPAFPPPPPKPTDAASPYATPLSESGSLSDGATLAESPSTPTYHGGMSLNSQAEPDQYPACPAFDEIVARLGAPTFLMLPIAVGATISFLRTHVPLPDSISPFPRILPGLTAANHMPPWDAVGVFNKMTPITQQAKGQVQNAVCMAIHWGTFISGPEEVLKTLGQLKWACHQQGVDFARSQDELQAPSKTRTKRGRNTFVALNHGASITL